MGIIQHHVVETPNLGVSISLYIRRLYNNISPHIQENLKMLRLMGIGQHDIVETPNLGVSKPLYIGRLYVTDDFVFLDMSVNIILIINRIIW